MAPAADGPDPYAWMRDRDRPAMREYLAAERAYYDRWLESVRRAAGRTGRRTGRAGDPGRGVGELAPGRPLLLHPDRAGPGVRAVLPGHGQPGAARREPRWLDPAGGGYLGLGVREVSPDGRLLAYSVDFDGDELYQLRIRDLARGTDLPERIEGTYYGLAWSADSRSLLYVVTDAQYRPHEVWRHVLGTGCPARTRWCSARRTGGST